MIELKHTPHTCSPPIWEYSHRKGCRKWYRTCQKCQRFEYSKDGRFWITYEEERQWREDMKRALDAATGTRRRSRS